MRLTLQIAAALVLDMVIGDPRFLPHPVRGIGRLAAALEDPLRRLCPTPRLAGICTALIVVGVTGLSSAGLVIGAFVLHPWAGDVVSVVLLWTAFAGRDLARHSTAVHAALKDRNLAEARRRVSWIVGRDTKRLDEEGIVRATVESVAENTVDGITAPLLFAVLGGPVGALVYKAVNTLDSMFGYQSERYIEFGWAAAKLDDVANWLPARLTGPMLAIAAGMLGKNAGEAMRVMWRDRRLHPSPNAGWTEAAMAGALEIQLGGTCSYNGTLSERPLLGKPARSAQSDFIIEANRIMHLTWIIFSFVLFAARYLVI